MGVEPPLGGGLQRRQTQQGAGREAAEQAETERNGAWVQLTVLSGELLFSPIYPANNAVAAWGALNPPGTGGVGGDYALYMVLKALEWLPNRLFRARGV